MNNMIDSLYNLTLLLLRGCIVTAIITGVYILGIIKYTKKYRISAVEVEKIKLNNITSKDNI